MRHACQRRQRHGHGRPPRPPPSPQDRPEMIVDGGVDGGEGLQRSHAPEAQHRPLPSSQWQVRVLRPIVEVASCLLKSGGAHLAQSRAVRAQTIRDDRLRRSMPPHRFLQEFQRRLAISALRHKGFQHLAFVIDRAPEVVRLAVDLHEHLVEVPPPLRRRSHPLDAPPRISAANIGPNRFHQNRTVSWLISMPRSWRRSSTLRSESGKDVERM
jgi:hypothetical protein